MADSGLSVAGGGNFRCVRDFHARVVFCGGFPQRAVFVRRMCGDFSRGKACGWHRSGKRSGVAVGDFSQCGDDAIRMGLGHFAGCVAGRNDFVGDAGAGGIQALARPVRLRTAVGPHADDQSIAGFASALLAWVGDVPRATRNKAARDEAWRWRPPSSRFCAACRGRCEITWYFTG